MIRAILFDAAGTLLGAHPSVGEIYADEARRFGVDVRADAVGLAFRDAWRTLRPYADSRTPFHTSEAIERAWWRALVERVFEDTCGTSAFGNRFDAFFDALYLRFERPDAWRLYDDVLPTLDALAQRGVPFAVVSNWDSRLPRLLHAMGIADRFAFVLTSAEAGVSKPSPEIFLQAIARLRLAPQNVLHVGDSMKDDVLAAQQAGLGGAHVDRSKVASDDDSSMWTLLDVLKKL